MKADKTFWPTNSPWYRYGVALLATAAATVVSHALTPVLGTDAPIIIYPLGVLAGAYVGGVGPGLLVTVLGALLSAHIFLPPAGLGVGLIQDQIRLSVFLFLGILISLLAETLRRSEQRGAAGAQALQESEERMRMAAEAAEVGTWFWDAHRDALGWSDKVRELLALPEGVDVTRAVFLGAVDPADRARVEAAYDGALASHNDYDVEFRVRQPDGSCRWVLAKGRGLYSKSGEPIGMHGVVMDVTERRQIMQQLQMLNDTLEQQVVERTAVARQRTEQIKILALELSQAEQRERRRLAEVLHDHLQQLLVGARFNVSILQGQLHDKEQISSVQQIEDLILQSIEATRTLTAELSPPILQKEGFVAALHWLAGWMQEKHGLHMDIQADDQAEPASEEVAVVLFRSVRELLFNVVKHAKVDRARVVARRPDDGHVEILVEDDGAGFDPAATPVQDSSGGFGLANVEERLELIDGQFDLHSAPGQGTRVRLLVPVSAGGDGHDADPSPSVALSQTHAHVDH